MPMNQEERRYIEYRPRIELPHELVYQRLSDDIQFTDQPVEIQETLSKPASDTYALLQETKGKLDALTSSVKNALANVESGGVTLDQYLASRNGEDDPTLRFAWEDSHVFDKDNGKAEGEILPILLSLEPALALQENFLRENGFLTPLQDGASVEQAIAEESLDLNKAFHALRQNEDDPVNAQLRMKNECVDIVTDNISEMMSFLEDTEAFLGMSDEAFFEEDSALDDALNEMSDSSLDGIQMLTDVMFSGNADQTQNLQGRVEDVPDMLALLHEDFAEIRKMKEKLVPMFQLFDAIEENGTSTGMFLLLEDGLNAMEQVLDEYDSLLQDMHSITALQVNHYTDILENVASKRIARVTSSKSKRQRKTLKK